MNQLVKRHGRVTKVDKTGLEVCKRYTKIRFIAGLWAGPGSSSRAKRGDPELVEGGPEHERGIPGSPRFARDDVGGVSPPLLRGRITPENAALAARFRAAPVFPDEPDFCHRV